MKEIELFKLLSDETRLRILNLVFHQELCVCELVEILELSQPKISKHIAKLRALKILKPNQKEQFIYYSFEPSDADMEQLIRTVLGSLKENPILIHDMNRMNTIESFVCSRELS